MKFMRILLIGSICGSLFTVFSGCENGTAATKKIQEPVVIAKKTTQSVQATPVIVIPEATYEFPTVVDGIKVTHDYLIENKGDADLEIRRVRTG